MDMVRTVWNSIRDPGRGATLCKLYVVAVNHWFDLRHAIRTESLSPLERLTVSGRNKRRGHRYEATRIVPLRRLLRRIRPLVPPDGVLVDLGCGKGRVLMIASEAGFREVRGVEFARELCEVARGNCTAYARKSGARTEFRIIESDVVEYAIRPDECVFFLFNPFDEVVLGRVLDNITRSLETSPRQLLVIYHNPRFEEVFDRRREFARILEFNPWGYRYLVYARRT